MTPLLRKCQSAWGLLGAVLRGWRTREKIVVIESDDWGGIRTASREAYDRLVDAGYPMARSHHSLDALETGRDLDLLFEVLDGVRDARGRPACMTANLIVANPDFERIRDAAFERYEWEPATATLARRDACRGVMARRADGLKRALFVPQLHAREHVCWWRWMEALRAGSAEARLTFDLGMCGVPHAVSREHQSFYVPVYAPDEELAEHAVDLQAMVADAVRLFAEQCGYRALSVTAPLYHWTRRTERAWWREGIRYIQGATFQHLGRGRRRTHRLGQRSPAGCWYLIRNCAFEPLPQGPDACDRALAEVARAFRFHKPAVIGSHRYNYIGSIDPDGRDRSLRALASLLKAVRERWPEVCFLSSPELGAMIEHRLDTVEALSRAVDVTGHPAA